MWFYSCSPESSIRPRAPLVYEQQTTSQRSERLSARPSNEGNADGNQYDLRERERERENVMHLSFIINTDLIYLYVFILQMLLSRSVGLWSSKKLHSLMSLTTSVR